MNVATQIAATKPALTTLALTTLAHEVYSAFAWACDLDDYSIERAVEIYALGARAVQLGEMGTDLHAIVADLFDAAGLGVNERTFAFQDGMRRAEKLWDAYATTLRVDIEGQLCIYDGDDLWLADVEQIRELAA